MDQLEAVNQILRAGQITSVTSVASPDRDTARAVTILENEKQRVLELGWDFNTDYDVELTEVAGQFVVPTDALSVDVWPQNSGGRDIVVRAGVLYDKSSNTDIFTQNTIKVEVVRDIDFDDCPRVMQTYIVDCACLEFAITVTVDAATAGQLREAKARSWQQVKLRDTAQAGYNPRNKYPLNQIASRWPQLPGGSSQW